jgi:soluble cytochrome b562
VRNVEIELEAALDKLRGAAKDLQKGVREAIKLVAEAQKELRNYMPGGCGRMSSCC